MNTVEEKMCNSILSGVNFANGNTTVSHENGVSNVYLHGNNIVRVTEKSVLFNDCGWQTRTTKSRINAVLRAFTKSEVASNGGRWMLTTRDGNITRSNIIPLGSWNRVER